MFCGAGETLYLKSLLLNKGRGGFHTFPAPAFLRTNEMIKQLRLLLLRFGYYKVVLYNYAYYESLSNENYVISVKYKWDYGLVHVNFKSSINRFFLTQLFEHFNVAKNEESEYTLSQIREIETRDSVHSFFSTVEYGKQELSSPVGEC